MINYTLRLDRVFLPAIHGDFPFSPSLLQNEFFIIYCVKKTSKYGIIKIKFHNIQINKLKCVRFCKRVAFGKRV